MAPTPGLNKNARTGGFNAFAAGDKVYGGGRTFPNIGPTSDPTGYKERNLQIKARQNAILRRAKKNAATTRSDRGRDEYLSRNEYGAAGNLAAPSTVAGGGTIGGSY